MMKYNPMKAEDKVMEISQRVGFKDGKERKV